MAARKPPAPVSRFGAPSERLQKLLLETNSPGPYAVTDQIVVTAPTKKRRQQMREAQTGLAVQQQLLTQAVNHTLAARPEFPAMPQPPGAKATKAQLAAYDAAVKHFDTLVANWETLNKEWEAAAERHQQVIEAINQQIAADSDKYTQALLGDAYQPLTDFFDELDEPAELWDSMWLDLQRHFRLIPSPPEVPDDGTCPTCGHVEDPERAGKAPKRST